MTSAKQILLVDDNPANLKILYETLDGRGYRLLVADNGEKALSIARKSRPDLILLDIMMPGLDGFEVCRELKSDLRTADSSVIFLSALDDTESKVRGFEVGGVDYVPKPFQVREVLARVENQLKIHALEQTLAARNRELAADKAGILNAMSEGVYGLDSAGQIVFANASAAALAGRREPELLGRDLLTLHFEWGESGALSEDGGEVQPGQVFWDAFQAGEALSPRKALWRSGQKDTFPVRYSMTPIPAGEQTTRAVVVFQDIRHELARDAELAAVQDSLESQRAQLAHVTRLSMMGEMAAGIAHEVNQPLTAVVNYAQLSARMLAKGDADSQALLGDTLIKIQEQAKRASQVIQHIRNFVKKPTEGKELVNPEELGRVIIDLADIESKEHSAQLGYEIGSNLPAVSAEPIQIQQVALNLIRNAIESCLNADMPARVCFRVRPDQEPPRRIYFEVEDEGPGIAKENRGQLFQPFFTTKKTGMGIGLTLCQSIIHSHGGEIGFEPAEGGGSRFWFWLPVA